MDSATCGAGEINAEDAELTEQERKSVSCGKMQIAFKDRLADCF